MGDAFGGGKKEIKSNLFEYTEEELLEDACLTHYEILNVPTHATLDQIKKAYRKCSLKYHPDKTGRGDDDYVKSAYDTLSDHVKRQGYDSTVLPFDDNIPPPRSTLLQDSMLVYKDQDFYNTFEPVFLRNLRFDGRLRPDLGKKVVNSHTKKHQHKIKEPPVLGDSDTPLPQVHAFYEYWIHFESWRDFSAQAADELQVENELENAESRFEKRWIQKEIDKRAKQLKRTEMSRIQTLVERAMEADPRLRKERQEQVLAKERAAEQRQRQKEREREQAEADAVRLAAEEEELRLQRAETKLEREREKKLWRKARQSLRKMTSSSFAEEPLSSSELWNDAYDMSQDVEFLCASMSLEELNQLNEDYETGGLLLVHQHILERKAAVRDAPGSGAAAETTTTTNPQPRETSNGKAGAPWTATELSALAKAVKKYPAGGAGRWEAICLLINNLCKQDIPRTREECIEKYNQMVRKNAAATNTKGASEVMAAVAAAVTNGSSTTTATDTASDVWTSEQDQLLQDALSRFPTTMDKNDRWTAIAEAVEGKTKKACVNRFKAIREALLLKNKKADS